MTTSLPSVRIFLSMVTSEFQACRKTLTGDLRRSLAIEVKVQEDFGGHAGMLLEKLDSYIAQCPLVIHLIGRSAGTTPPKGSVDHLKEKYPDLAAKVPCLEDVFRQGKEYEISYTQWEAYLALYHHENGLFVINYLPDGGQLPVDDVARRKMDSSQQEHLVRLMGMGWDCTSSFSEPQDLSSLVYRSLFDRHLANERPQATWPRSTIQSWQTVGADLCRRWHKAHQATQPSHRVLQPTNNLSELANESLESDRGALYWGLVSLRVFAVLQALHVLRTVFSELNLRALQEDRSLEGMQRLLFISWLNEFNIVHVLLIAGIGWAVAQTWPWFMRKWEQLRRLWKAAREMGHWQRFVAKSVDLALMPFELTIVLPTIPIAAKEWMQSVEQLPSVNGINPAYFLYALILALAGTLVAVEVARYWPSFRHWRRHMLSPTPRPAPILLAISGALGMWIGLDPLLIPTGSTKTFAAEGSVVTHLAADATTSELAVASQGERFRSTSSDSVMIQLVTLPSLDQLEADLDGVPWQVEFDRDRLMGLAFHERRLTAHLGEPILAGLQTFRVWHRDRSSQLVASGAPEVAELGNGGKTILSERGWVVSYKNINNIEQILGTADPSNKPSIFVASAPREDLKEVPSDWVAQLNWIETVALSLDGGRIAVAGHKFVPPPPNNDNLYDDGTTQHLVGIVDVASGRLVGSVERWTDELALSPDGEWLQTADDGVDHSNPLTASFGSISTQHQLVFHRLSDQFAREIPIPEKPAATIWSPDSRHVAVRYPYRLEIYSVLRGELLKSFIAPRGKWICHAYSPDGKYLLAGTDRGRVWMYRISDSKPPSENENRAK